MVDVALVRKVITGKDQTPGDVQRVLAVAHASGFDANDSMLPILVAMDAYAGLFSELPDRMKAVADSAAQMAAGKAQGQVEAAVAAAVTSLTPAVALAVQWISVGISIGAMVLVLGFLAGSWHAQDEVAAAVAAVRAETAGAIAGAKADGAKLAAWAGTPNGQRAYKWDQTGALNLLLTCSGEGWSKEKRSGHAVCFGYSGENAKGSGWSLDN